MQVTLAPEVPFPRSHLSTTGMYGSTPIPKVQPSILPGTSIMSVASRYGVRPKRFLVRANTFHVAHGSAMRTNRWPLRRRCRSVPSRSSICPNEQIRPSRISFGRLALHWLNLACSGPLTGWIREGGETLGVDGVVVSEPGIVERVDILQHRTRR